MGTGLCRTLYQDIPETIDPECCLAFPLQKIGSGSVSEPRTGTKIPNPYQRLLAIIYAGCGSVPFSFTISEHRLAFVSIS
jgi:hypothetical protein